MAKLTAEENSIESSLMSSQSSPCRGKFEPAQGSANTSPLHPLLYVRYKDHVFFKNLQNPKTEAIERETIGWVKGETDELLLLENDRAIPSHGKNVNGFIILKNCIVETHPLLLQNNLKWVLNSAKPTVKDEYAFRPSERKTQRAKKLQRRKLD